MRWYIWVSFLARIYSNVDLDRPVCVTRRLVDIVYRQCSLDYLPL